MRKKYLLLTIVCVSIIVTIFAVNSLIPKYGIGVFDKPVEDACDITIQHGVFSEYPIFENMILQKIKNPDPNSNYAEEIPFYEYESYFDMIQIHFPMGNDDCFGYLYEGEIYPLWYAIGPKAYFTHPYID